MPTLADLRQDAAFNCAEAAIAVALDRWSIRVPIRLSTPEDGADPRMVEQFFRTRPLRMRVVSGEMTVDDLAHFTRLGKPVITLVHWPGDADSHYVVVGRVTGACRRTVHYQDVWSGPGKRPESEFVAAWHATGRLADSFRQWGVCAWPGSSS